jgi:hypothetical protein
LDLHPPETPAILVFWRAPLIGECVDFAADTVPATVFPPSADGKTVQL